nr:methylmalonyl-CoA epimerase, mitochondrial isoform X8 [Symphalangus syndactylus]
MARALKTAAANAVELHTLMIDSLGKSTTSNRSYILQELNADKGLFSRLRAPIPTVRASSTSQPLDQVAGSVWNLGRLNHVAIAVPDLEKAAAFYKNILGAQVTGQNQDKLSDADKYQKKKEKANSW